VFAKQVHALKAESRFDFEPVHIMMNMMGMILFPFLSKNVIINSGAMGDKQFISTITERKRLIPIWMKQMLGI
jgi:hypothetical protein